MAVIERSEALERAHDYLSKTGANNWKQGDELKRRSDGKTYMQVAHLIADIYQRGERPKDLDLQRIDFSVSSSNINKQIDQLLTERGADQFDKEKEATRQSEMERAEELIEEDKQKREELRRQIEEEMDEAMQGELFEARENAWTGYQLGSLDSRSMFNPLLEMIEYAKAILEINEEMEEQSNENFEVLRERKREMEELVKEIEELNERAETAEPSEEDDPELSDSDVIFEDFKGQMSEEDKEILTEPFGEIQMQIIKPEESELEEADSSEDIREHIRQKIGSEATEHVLAVYLEGDNDILGTQTIAKGGFDSVEFDERQIVQAGIMMNASAVIIAHNHPSGALEFTQQDGEASIDLERQLEEFDIQLMDMILVTQDGHKSMKEAGRGAFV